MPRPQVIIRCTPGIMVDDVIQSIGVTKGVDVIVLQADKNDGRDWSHLISTHRGQDQRVIFGEDIMFSRNEAEQHAVKIRIEKP